MKKVFITLISTLSLAGLIGCSSTDSPTKQGLQADLNRGTLQVHSSLPNQALTSDNIEEFLGSIVGSSFLLDNIAGLTSISGLQKKLSKKSASSISFDTTLVLDTAIDGLSGSADVNATVKCHATGSDEEMTSITASIQNASIVFNNFSVNDSVFCAGQIVVTGNLSMVETSMSGSLTAKAGIRFNGLYEGELTMDLSVSVSGNPASDAGPTITGNLSMSVTSKGSSFTYTQDLSELQELFTGDL